MVVQVRLLPGREQGEALAETLARCNEAANLASGRAFECKVFRRFGVQRLVYGELKLLGLSAQPAIRTIAKVCDAYSRDRRVRHRFRPGAAQPYDARCLSWNLDERTVSIWTTRGRLKGVPFACAPWQLKLLRAHRRGESDLLQRAGKWFLIATCDLPEPAPNTSPEGFLGVDLGIVNIATTSDGIRYAGTQLNRARHRNRRLRGKLQKKGTISAKRLLKKRRRREALYAKDVNHCISKRIVAEAQRSGRGIALEQLKGIRARVKARKPQRATLHSWAFAQLGDYLAYKAIHAGVPLVHVNPAYTSQQCSSCANIDKHSRPTRQPSNAPAAASLSTQTQTQPKTSPSALLWAGPPSNGHTQTSPPRRRTASSGLQAGVFDPCRGSEAFERGDSAISICSPAIAG
jgi:putative transposase